MTNVNAVSSITALDVWIYINMFQFDELNAYCVSPCGNRSGNSWSEQMGFAPRPNQMMNKQFNSCI